MKKFLVLFLTLIITEMPLFAFQLDMSVDEEIRKHYNPGKIEQENLPPLPKTALPQNKPSANSNTNTAPVVVQPTVPPKTSPVATETPKKKINKDLPGSELVKDDFTAIKIKKGTKFKLKSNGIVSDYLREGAKVSFTSLAPVYQRYVTIPAGTVFTATVADSHLPQITGNGGLVVLTIDKVQFRGRTYNAYGKVTKANHKKIFINNIKGKRQYWKGVLNQIDKGEKFYSKTRKMADKLANNPVGIIICPIPVIVGAVVYVVNFAGSPVFAIGNKGGRVSIPAGSEFEIKLKEDIYLSL